MAKSKKIEKDTRRLISSVTDMVKRKGDRYKFKVKSKKVRKKVKKTCPHWIFRKGKETPTVQRDTENPGMWRCTICGATFPIKPLTSEGKGSAYAREAEKMLQLVNQMQFWSVKLGGDSDDTKMFLKLRELLPAFGKASSQIVKRINKREEYERNRQHSDVMSQFDDYSGFNYH